MEADHSTVVSNDYDEATRAAIEDVIPFRTIIQSNCRQVPSDEKYICLTDYQEIKDLKIKINDESIAQVIIELFYFSYILANMHTKDMLKYPKFKFVIKGDRESFDNTSQVNMHILVIRPDTPRQSEGSNQKQRELKNIKKMVFYLETVISLVKRFKGQETSQTLKLIRDFSDKLENVGITEKEMYKIRELENIAEHFENLDLFRCKSILFKYKIYSPLGNLQKKKAIKPEYYKNVDIAYVVTLMRIRMEKDYWEMRYYFRDGPTEHCNISESQLTPALFKAISEKAETTPGGKPTVEDVKSVYQQVARDYVRANYRSESFVMVNICEHFQKMSGIAIQSTNDPTDTTSKFRIRFQFTPQQTHGPINRLGSIECILGYSKYRQIYVIVITNIPYSGDHEMDFKISWLADNASCSDIIFSQGKRGDTMYVSLRMNKQFPENYAQGSSILLSMLYMLDEMSAVMACIQNEISKKMDQFCTQELSRNIKEYRELSRNVREQFCEESEYSKGLYEVRSIVFNQN